MTPFGERVVGTAAVFWRREQQEDSSHDENSFLVNCIELLRRCPFCLWVIQKRDLFVTKAAGDNLAEVKLGQLAVQKGTDQKVKDLGNRMVNDHQKANNDLKPIADANGVKWPDRPPPMKNCLD